MHCLYCDRPLALIKRLTGDGEFCSKECRKNYQLEHNQLALARLLETQPPKAAPKPIVSKSKASAPPAAPPPVRVQQPQERLPQPAGFLRAYPPDASGAPDALQYRGNPHFEKSVPVNEAPSDSKGRRRRPQPNTAVFQSETVGPRPIGGEMQFGNRWGFKLVYMLPPNNARDMAGRQPGGAGLVSEKRVAPTSTGVVRPSSGPKFQLGSGAKASAGSQVLAIGRHPRLRPAKFIAQPVVVQFAAGDIRHLAAAPRWKALQPALPDQLVGRIVFVLGTFLRRPVRTAGQDGFPEIFEIPLRPVSFPPFSPRMACLEERMHRTDRIGFSPP